MRRAAGPHHPLAIVFGGAAGLVGLGAAIAGEQLQGVGIGGDGRIFPPGGGDQTAIGFQGAGAKSHIFPAKGLARCSGLQLGLLRRWAQALGPHGDERSPRLPVGLHRHQRARIQHPRGRQGLSLLPAAERAGESRFGRRAARADLMPDGGSVDRPSGLQAAERIDRQGREARGVGVRGCVLRPGPPAPQARAPKQRSRRRRGAAAEGEGRQDGQASTKPSSVGRPLIPAKAGIQIHPRSSAAFTWIPAFAGMSGD